MSMHLSNVRVTPRKHTTKLTKTKLKELKENHIKHNRWLKQHHMKSVTFDEYVDQVMGRQKISHKPTHKTFKPLTSQPGPYRRGDTSHIPSKTDDSGIAARKDPNVYDGERELIGIDMLHKSNLVPVFNKQDAKDNAKMRRN